MFDILVSDVLVNFQGHLSIEVIILNLGIRAKSEVGCAIQYYVLCLYDQQIAETRHEGEADDEHLY
jgi:hypothetical protein